MHDYYINVLELYRACVSQPTILLSLEKVWKYIYGTGHITFYKC